MALPRHRKHQFNEEKKCEDLGKKSKDDKNYCVEKLKPRPKKTRKQVTQVKKIRRIRYSFRNKNLPRRRRKDNHSIIHSLTAKIQSHGKVFTGDEPYVTVDKEMRRQNQENQKKLTNGKKAKKKQRHQSKL